MVKAPAGGHAACTFSSPLAHSLEVEAVSPEQVLRPSYALGTVTLGSLGHSLLLWPVLL